MTASGAPARWPLLVIGAPAAVAVWTGWVGLGTLAGFGLVQPLPGIVDWSVDTRITLPLGMEAYGIYALHQATSASTPAAARRWAAWSAAGSFLLGLVAQVAYHLMTTAGMQRSPWPVTALVSAVPVLAVMSSGLLWHLARVDPEPAGARAPAVEPVVEPVTAPVVERAAPVERAEPVDAPAPARPLAAAPAPRRTPSAPRRAGDELSQRRAREAWDRAESSGTPMTGPQLARLLGVSDGQARKVAARWRAESEPTLLEATP